MKLRSKTVVVSCLALIVGSAIIWHFIHAELTSQQLAKNVTASRIRAEQGDPESQFRLGSIYFHGKGVPKDYVEAVRWYRKSAEQGDAKGQYSLGYMYHEGNGVPQDYAEATRWWRKAAEQGDARAQDLSALRTSEAKGWHRTMRRLFAGTANPPNKFTPKLNTTLDTCITTATGCRRT